MLDPRSLTDVQIVALTIAGEARGEKSAFQMAVGNVIRNRWDLARAGRAYRKAQSIGDICLWPYQFSCWLPADPNRRWIDQVVNRSFPSSLDAIVFDRILDMAQGWIQGGYQDAVERADHYHCFPEGHKAWPKWARGRAPVTVVGTGKFYRLFL